MLSTNEIAKSMHNINKENRELTKKIMEYVPPGMRNKKNKLKK